MGVTFRYGTPLGCVMVNRFMVFLIYMPDEAQAMKVNALWKANEKAWNVQQVQACYDHDTARLILRTPLNEFVQEDRIIWNQSNDGLYSVKTAYHMVLSDIVDCSHLRLEGDWAQIWKLDVPAIVKIFLCHACTGTLPSRS